MQTTVSNALKKVKQKNEQSFIPVIQPEKFSIVTNKMRTFFLQKGFQEVHTQNRISIMAACEDPNTIAMYEYLGEKWPLPQTGQMWLEYELLTKPNVPGYFCVSTSYRNEPNPTPGRHHRIFPMFEFELHGDIKELEKLETEFLEYLGFTPNANGEFPGGNYEDVAKEYGTSILTNADEEQLYEDHGDVYFLRNFPERTSPFWNMKRNEINPEISSKVDVIMHGMETIGSAERSCSADEQRQAFLTIEDGAYAQKLYDLFGKERVLAELEDFLSHDFFPRSGGGIGITRMMRAMELSGLV